MKREFKNFAFYNFVQYKKATTYHSEMEKITLILIYNIFSAENFF